VVGDRILLCHDINHAKTVSSTHVLFSDDEGQSFSEPVPIWDRIEEHRFCGYDGFVHLGGDRLLLPYQTSKEVWTPGEHITISTVVSDDGGETWREQQGRIDLPMRGAMEPSIARFDDGMMLMSMRTQLGSVFTSRSTDDGRTWSLAQTTGLKSPESCTCLRRIPHTESLVLFWNDSTYLPDHHHYGHRTPLSVARSDDRGETWTRLFDLEDQEWYEYTNLACTFTSAGTAILTYLESEGTPDGAFARSCMRLKAATIDVGAFG
jgi:sialidase-1